MFLSICYYCNSKLLMMGNKKHNQYACTKCIRKDSSSRNGIEETYEYEILRFKTGGRKTNG